MGDGPTFKHFSHEHPLRLTQLLKPTTPPPCRGCDRPLLHSKTFYTCETGCPFSLHSTCFTMPRKIRHPGDSNQTHDLILRLLDSFRCKACSNTDMGFAYNCKICKQNYHPLCTLRPLSTTHYSHQHPLTLKFSSLNPDGSDSFSCYECTAPCSNHWLYRCTACNFNIHLMCANSTNSSPPPPPTSTSRSMPSGTNHGDQGSISPIGSQPNGYSFNSSNPTMGMPSSTNHGSQGPIPPNGSQPNGYNFHLVGPRIIPPQPQPQTQTQTQQLRLNHPFVMQQSSQVRPAYVILKPQGYGYGTNQMVVRPNQNQGPMGGMGVALAEEALFSAISGRNDGPGGSDNGSDIVGSWVGGGL